MPAWVARGIEAEARRIATPAGRNFDQLRIRRNTACHLQQACRKCGHATARQYIRRSLPRISDGKFRRVSISALPVAPSGRAVSRIAWHLRRWQARRPGDDTTYVELEEASNRLASHLVRSGLAPGERVGIILPQSVETVVAHLAIYKSGLVAVPLARLFAADAIAYRLARAGARAVITTPRRSRQDRKRCASACRNWAKSSLPAILHRRAATAFAQGACRRLRTVRGRPIPIRTIRR